MEYRTLGKTGLKVSEVGFGAWAIGGPAKLGDREIGWGAVNDEVSIRAVHAALDAGVNLIDTSDAYGLGHSEEVLGRALEGRRDSVIIADKFGNRVVNGEWLKDFSRTWIEQACDASLQRLKTDHIDLYQAHSAFEPEQYTDEMIETLEDLKSAGKIRHYGISVKETAHGPGVIRRWPQLEAIQVVYSILARQAEAELFPLAQEHDIGILARVPLASGFLTGKFKPDVTFPPDDHRSGSYPPEKAREIVTSVEKLRFLERDGKTLAQAALQFCLMHPAVSTAIPGARNPEQATGNAAASDGALLTTEEVAQIRETVSGDVAGQTIRKP